MSDWVVKQEHIRHVHFGYEPSMADPAGDIVFAETASHGAGLYVYWTGWRCRLIRWLINRWMPTPIVWFGKRRGGTQ